MSPRRLQTIATVSANDSICREHWRLILNVESFPPTSAGQFVQLACGPGGDELDGETEFRSPTAMLRRPFSLAGRRDLSGSVELSVIHRVVGVGTDWLSRLRIGDHLTLIGPLGNRFALPNDDQTALLVGGGVGIPPMLYLAEALAGRKAVAFVGAMSRSLLPLSIIDLSVQNDPEPAARIDEFAHHGIPTLVSTDDGTFGHRGFVTELLESFLHRNENLDTVIYTCGPEPMMKRVAALAAAAGRPCQVAVERAMACGMGTCQSCCIRVKKSNPALPPLAGSSWAYRLACTDGPIFMGADLLW